MAFTYYACGGGIMQTFLPYADFYASAKVLDNSRLGKQRVEVLQILKAIIDGVGWIHHPATHMWRGHTNVLVNYGIVMCNEWIDRRHMDTCLAKIANYENPSKSYDPPLWIGNEDFHASHRSNLVRKGYTCFTEDASLPYCWPILVNGKWHMRFKHAGAPKYELDMEYVI